jgi:hypothetical protein
VRCRLAAIRKTTAERIEKTALRASERRLRTKGASVSVGAVPMVVGFLSWFYRRAHLG